MHSVLEFNQSQRLNPYVKFNTQKKIEADKNGDKDRKVLYKILNNAVNGKTTESLRNRIDLIDKICKQQKRVFEMGIKIKLYVTKNIWQYSTIFGNSRKT